MAVEIILYFICLTIAFLVAKVLVATISGFTLAKEIASISLITFTMFPIFVIVFPVLVGCLQRTSSPVLMPFILPIIYFFIEMILLQKATNRNIYDVNNVCIGMNLFGYVMIALMYEFNLLEPNYSKCSSLFNKPIISEAELTSIAVVMCCISFTSYMFLIKIIEKNKYENENIDDIKYSIHKTWIEDAHNNFKVLLSIPMKTQSLESIKELITKIILLGNERLRIRNEIIELKSNINDTLKCDIINRFIYMIAGNDHIKSKYDYINKNRKLISEFDEKICSQYEKLIDCFPEEMSEYQNKLNTK